MCIKYNKNTLKSKIAGLTGARGPKSRCFDGERCFVQTQPLPTARQAVLTEGGQAS